MRRRPETVGKTIRTLLRKLGVERIVERHALWSCWEEIVGPEIAAHTRPEFFSGKTLFVSVDHAVWLHQLGFLKDPIRAKINDRLGPAAVSEIRFRIGRFRPRDREPRPSRPAETALTPEEEGEIRACVASLQGADLREGLDRILRKDLKQKKSCRRH